MDDVKRLGTPLLIIVLSAFLTKLVETWLKGGFVHTLLIIIMVASLFMFGVSLNRKKRSNAVVVWFHCGGFYYGSALEQTAYDGFNLCEFGDVVVVTVNHRINVLGYLDLAIVNRWFAYLGMGSFYINMLYIFCGYLFVD